MSVSSIGFIELLALLTHLGTFGIAQNPKAAPPAELMKYAPAQPDYVVYVDLEAVIPNNYKALVALPAKIKSPAVQAKLQAMIKNVETSRQLVKGMAGIDPITDVKSVAVFVKPAPTRGLELIAVVRGKFPQGLLAKAGPMMGKPPETIGGVSVIKLPNNMLAAVAKDGALLVGTDSWVRARVGGGWKPVARPRGSAGAHAAQLLRTRPFMTLVSSPSALAKKGVVRRIRGAGAFVREVLTGHKLASLAVAHNGVSWTWQDVGPVGYQRAVLGSEGILELFRAMHYGARGIVKLGFSALASYAGKHAMVDMLLKHQKELLNAATKVTGDGKFQVRWRKDPRNHSVSVRAYAQRLTQVVPLAAVVPMIGAGAWLGIRQKQERPPAHITRHRHHGRAGMKHPEFRPRTPRLNVRRTYRRIKRQHLGGMGHPPR